MDFHYRHWAIALLAAAFLQLVLGAVLQRPQSKRINSWPAGVEIQIGSSLTSAGGREGPKTAAAPAAAAAAAAASVSPSSIRAQTESSAALEPASAATTSHPEINQFKAVSLPTPHPEKKSTPVVASQPKHKARIQPAVGTEANPPEEKRRRQGTEKNTMSVRSEIATYKTVSSPATQTATLISSQKRDSSGATGIAGTSGKGGSTVAAEAVSPDYYRSLAAWLEKHKRYPRRAVQRRQQGIVKVSFKIDRKGNLLSRKIVGSSGYRLLDEAADSLLQRASPMPGIPHHSTAQVLEFIVPIMYALR